MNEPTQTVEDMRKLADRLAQRVAELIHERDELLKRRAEQASV